MASNPWDSDPIVQPGGGSAVPQAPGVIYGAPKVPDPPTPIQIEDQQMQRDAARRAQMEWEATHNPDGTKKPENGGSGTVDEKKIATLLTRIAGGANDIKNVTKNAPDAAAPGLFEAIRGDLTPGGVTGPLMRGLAGEERRTVHDAQRDILDALLTLGTGAAYNAEQLSGQMVSYFPQYGDSENEAKVKATRLQRLVEAAKANAGPAWAQIEPQIAPLMGDPASIGTGGRREEETPKPADGVYWKDPETGAPYYGDDGNPLGPQGGLAYDAQGNAVGLVGSMSGLSQYDQEIQAAKARFDEILGPYGSSDLLRQGATGNLGDEAAGVGTVISSALGGDFDVSGNYTRGRDIERARLADARKREGGMGAVAEVMGSLVSGGTKGFNALTTPTQVARESALLGGVTGYGMGEGFENSVTSGVMGAGFSGALGYGGARLGERLANRVPGTSNAPDLGAKARELSAAGQAEGVTVNRAMIDPALENRFTGVDASLIGGPRVQRGMREIEGQIEGRVNDLGRGGTPLNPEEAGNMLRGASERFIDRTGKSARVKYNRAEKLAGNAKVEPKQSLAAVDQMIAALSETPSQNSAEIAYLNSLKNDLSQDLSVGALRRMRTKLRKTISKGDLVFGEDEARVLEIMNTAADDIRTGLTAQGKVDAANSFDAADKAYRARMGYINDTVQKVIGRRGTNRSAEALFSSFSSMAKGKDARGLRQFYATLDPEESADVAATFAKELGKDNKGNFSVANFLSQTEKLSESAIQTIFGREGAKSIQNLQAIGNEVKRVTGTMNSRKSGTSVGNDWKSWVTNLVLGASPGAYSGSIGTAAGGAAAVGGVKAGADLLSARALMSTKLARWLRSAPRTSDPKEINAHFNKLGQIARAEPAIAQEIEALQRSIMSAANDNAGRMGSAVASPNEGPDQQ